MLSVYEELSEASRRMILLELRSGPKSVSEIVLTTGLKQPNVSNHLARLRQRGIVRGIKVGRQVFYSLSSGEVEAAIRSAFADSENVNDEIDFEAASNGFAHAAIQGDEQASQEIVDRAIQAGCRALDIFEELLTPAMGLVGSWYKLEAIDVAQEHMASSIMERVLARMTMAMNTDQYRGRIAVVGCASNNWHVIGLRMVSDFLRLNGWRSLYLGANVPIESFMETVRYHSPELVLTSCSADASVNDTVSLIRTLARTNNGSGRRYRIGIGGLAVVDRGQDFIRAGADFTAITLRQFAESQLPLIESSISLG